MKNIYNKPINQDSVNI